MIGETIIFGKNAREQSRLWKIVHETEDQIICMLYDLGAERMEFDDAQDYLQKDFVILSEEERSRIIPNEAGDLLWLPSVKQLGFVPVESDDENDWELNEIPKDLVPKKVWKEETFQYFANPETAVERRQEFGSSYWTSSSRACYPRLVWNVLSIGSAFSSDVRTSNQVRPCVILKKTAVPDASRNLPYQSYISMLGVKKCITIAVTSSEEAFQLAAKIHEQLVGNQDYVNSDICLYYDKDHVYFTVFDKSKTDPEIRI